MSATFSCSACGNVAATVQFVPPEPRGPRTDADSGGVKSAHAGVSIAGGPVPVTLYVAGDWSAAAIEALRNEDAKALNAVNREFTPFWCRTCEKSYCAEHWDTEDIWDEGFFDYTQGICPEGHKQMLMD